jgi:hypothetical protein
MLAVQTKDPRPETCADPLPGQTEEGWTGEIEPVYDPQPVTVPKAGVP